MRTDVDAAPGLTAALARRDLSVDLVRVTCVLLVVVLHSLMVGLGTDAAGAIVWTNPLQREPWFPVLSWFGQIMPLFFIVGGFATWHGLASNARRGGTARDFVRARILRLGVPALVWFLGVGAALWACVGLGVPALVWFLGVGAALWTCVGLGVPVPVLQALAGGVGMPLWFLAAYLLCQAVAPATARLHVTHRLATPIALLAGVAAVDALRFSTGTTAIGLVNLLLVWPLAQQIGFFLADGTLARIPRPAVALATLASFGVVALLGSTGPWSADMLTDLNPPTLPLVFVGIGQLGIFLLVRPALEALMRRRAAQAVVLVLGTRLMTIYLWHLLVVILFSALTVALPGVLPAAGTSAWWWERIPTIAAEFGVVLALTIPLARFERLPRIERLGAAPRWPVLSAAVVLATVPPFWAMEFRLDLAGLVWGSAMLAVAVRLACGAPRPGQRTGRAVEAVAISPVRRTPPRR